jgi:hypothetical protein
MQVPRLWPIELRPSRRIEAQLLTRPGEHVELALPHHSVAFWPARLWLLAAALWTLLVITTNSQVAALFPAMLMALWGYWLWLRTRLDWFVVTNKRIFRIQGVLNHRVPAMSIARIVDITMEQPFWGQVLGYGHFVFENAAQDQGLREIRYIARPAMVNKRIQELIIGGGDPRGTREPGDGHDPAVHVPRQPGDMDATGEIQPVT